MEIKKSQNFGTIFYSAEAKASSRLLWLAHASTPRGRLILDDGAVTAVLERGVSLLPAGVTAVEGDFVAGDTVEIIAWTISSLGVTGPTGPTGVPGTATNTGATGPANIYAYNRNTYTATAGQTSFVAPYTPGFVDVYVNGIKYAISDYTAIDGVTVNLAQGAQAGDVVEIIARNFGDTIIGTKRVQSDGIHPSWAGYSELAEKTK